MQFSDRILSCAGCGEEFVFTAGEQLFFHERQFTNDPKRCKPCKAKRTGQMRNGAMPLARTETRADCSACGKSTTVPFKPTQGRPVLCRECFEGVRTATAAAAVEVPNIIATVGTDVPELQVAVLKEDEALLPTAEAAIA